MISPFEVYLVMQMDSIIVVAVVIGACLLISAAAACFYGGLKNESEASATGRRLAKYAFILLAISAFLPSTKTTAAMIVIPAIANNEAIQKEAGDLYAIAKQALKDSVATEEPKKE
jgi:hypothetical protein